MDFWKLTNERRFIIVEIIVDQIVLNIVQDETTSRIQIFEESFGKTLTGDEELFIDTKYRPVFVG